jgi:DNA repair protein RecN (Recombination protein N)
VIRDIRVANLGIIREASVELSPWFNVVTGETGAGKTLFTSAVRAALGDGTALELVGIHGDEGFCEIGIAVPRTLRERDSFVSELAGDEDEIIVRREFSRSGRARTYINGRSVPASVARELGNRLVAIHSQNSHLEFLKPSNQITLLDRSTPEVLRAAEDYRQVWSRAVALVEEFIAHQERLSKVRRERELLAFQLEEIRNANLVAGEEEELRAAREEARHRKEIIDNLTQAVAALSETEASALMTVGTALAALERLAALTSRFEDVVERLRAAHIEIEEAQREIRRYLDDVSLTPADLDSIEARLYLIDTLKKKYGPTVEDIIEKGREIEALLAEFDESESSAAHAWDEITRVCEDLRKAGIELGTERAEAGRRLRDRVNERLPQLMLAYLTFDVVFEPVEFDVGGAKEDIAKVLATPGEGNLANAVRLREALDAARQGFETGRFVVKNPGADFEPVSSVASGGEVSRLLLALETALSSASDIAVYCFDEVDAGVGGEAGARLGSYLKQLAGQAQVMCVTHLPQVAAFADRHFVVERGEKDGVATASVREVRGEERIAELARMLSGEMARAKAVEHARDLIARAAEVVGQEGRS